MKKLLLLVLISFWVIGASAKSGYDSVNIYPKPAKNVINITKIGCDSPIFNIFLFKHDGHMVKSSLDTDQMYVSDVNNGEYVLEIFDDRNRYRFYIHVEN